jgi:hypothetical protein
MKIIFLLIVSQIFFSCYQNKTDIDFIEMNKRFDYDNINTFKDSVRIYAKNNLIKIDINKINFNQININQIIKAINLDLHEAYIEKNPNDIFNLISIAKDNANIDKIIFESMQAYLRSINNLDR